MIGTPRLGCSTPQRASKFRIIHNHAQTQLCGCLVLAMLTASAVATAGSIGFNLREGDADSRLGQMLAPEDLAGQQMVAQRNWNDVYISKEQGFVLNDNTGAATTATVRWGAANAWGDGSVPEPGNTPNETLARGNFDDGDGLSGDLATGFVGAEDDGVSVTIEVADVPYSEYSVVLYLSSDRGTGSNWGEYLVNGQGKSGGQNDGFANIGDWIANRNVLAFTGLTESTVDIAAPIRMDPIAGQIAGVQIIEGTAVIPEPATAGLLALAVAGAAAVACRRHRVTKPGA